MNLNWQPITTAPHNNEPLLVETKEGHVCEADNYCGLWNMPSEYSDERPVRWMLRPSLTELIADKLRLDILEDPLVQLNLFGRFLKGGSPNELRNAADHVLALRRNNISKQSAEVTV